MTINTSNLAASISRLININLFDILSNRFSQPDFKVNTLLKFREITVTGTNVDIPILTTTKNFFVDKPLTASTIEVFLKNLNNDTVLVDKIILLATKKILETPINDDALYERLQLSLKNMSIEKADHELFITKVVINGGQLATNGSILFPTNQQVLDLFLAEERTRFDKKELLITDYNGTSNKAYLPLIGNDKYEIAQNEIYTQRYPNADFNTRIVDAFLPNITEKYYNEHLLISLHELVSTEQYEACQKDIVRNRIDKEKILGPVTLLDIYKRRLNQPPFNEQVTKAKEKNIDLTFLVLMESLNRELPVFVSLLYQPNIGTLAINLAKLKIIEKFGQDFFTKFFMINIFLQDLIIAIDLELNSLWSTPWTTSQTTAISSYTSQNYYAPNLDYVIPPPNGVGLTFPPGSTMIGYFNDVLLAAKYRNQQNPKMVIESIAEYLDNVYPKFSKTTPYPYLPNPFAF